MIIEECEEHQEEEEDEKEEVIVVLSFPELDGLINLANEDVVLQFADLDSTSPKCFMNNLEYEGVQKCMLGTNLIFSPTTNSDYEDALVGSVVNQIEFHLKNVTDISVNTTKSNNPTTQENNTNQNTLENTAEDINNKQMDGETVTSSSTLK